MALDGMDGSIESAVDLMVSPEILGTTESVEKPVVEAEHEEEPEVLAKPEEEAETEEPESEIEEPEIEAEVQLEAESPEAEGEPITTYTVKVDGADTEVSLDDLKQGYSGQQYVQQGMREAAESRKEAQAVYTQLQQERHQIGQMLQAMQSGQFTPPPLEPNKELFNTDPLQYMELKIQYDEQKAGYDEQMGNLQRVAGQATQADQNAMKTYMEGELKQLRAVEPDFADPEKAPAVKEKMLSVGKEVYGYAPEEISQITDHRAVRVLRDAIRYQELKKSAAGAEVKVKAKVARTTAKRKVVTSGEAGRRKQIAKLKQSGSIDDALGLLMQ